MVLSLLLKQLFSRIYLEFDSAVKACSQIYQNMTDEEIKKVYIEEDTRLNSWHYIEDAEERTAFLERKIKELQNFVEELSSKTNCEIVASLLPMDDPGSDFVYTTRSAGFARELDAGIFTKDFMRRVSNAQQDYKRIDRAFLESLFRKEMNILVRKSWFLLCTYLFAITH